MRNQDKIALFILSVFFLFFVLSGQAYAYIDPGTGSYVIQVIIASVVAAGFAVQMFWKRISGFFKNLFSKKVQ